MPELPEVETIARQLRPLLLGRTFVRFWTDAPATVARPSPAEVAARLPGQRIEALTRRGKYLLLALSREGAPADTLILHLGMTGRLTVAPADAPTDRHLHTRFDLDDGHQLRFHDVRKFGRIFLVEDPALVVGHLGPEPLDDAFTLAHFRQRIRRRRGRLKPLLLDQRFLAGVGNLYADEALFLARLDPRRLASSLSDEEIARLYHSLRRVLRRGIEGEGASLRDYRKPDGSPGRVQESLQVYGRAGAPCPRCGTPIQRLRLAGRSAHFCPTCQRAGG